MLYACHLLPAVNIIYVIYTYAVHQQKKQSRHRIPLFPSTIARWPATTRGRTH